MRKSTTAQPSGKYLRKMVKRLFGRGTSIPRRLWIALCLLVGTAYVFAPVDIIPDITPYAGLMDDWGVMMPSLVSALKELKLKLGYERGMSWREWLMMLFALFYFFNPFDFTDVVPVLGVIDDWIVALLVFWPTHRDMKAADKAARAEASLAMA